MNFTMNILTFYLKLIKIKHTKTYSGKLFNEHPNKFDLYGLSSMLSDYGIENEGLRFDNKRENLPLLEAPFIAHTGHDFVIVTNNTPQNVDYLWKNKKISVTADEFIRIWSGIVLLAEPNENSGEPDYRLHREKEFYKNSVKYLLMFLSALCIGLLYVYRQLYCNPGLSTSLIINFIGVYVCYMLLLKQMKIEGSYADKICSLLKQGDCTDILESDSAKLFGLFGWSEIGFGYFISNCIIILCFPNLTSFLAIVNICALPFTFWSVWYQKKAEQWCVLCLIVQALLWIIFIINLLFGNIQISALLSSRLISLLLTGIIYLIPLLSIHLLISCLSESVRVGELKQEINSLKANEDIFHALIKKQPHYRVNKEDSMIVFGDPESKNIITMLTNPHCIPCAKMHARINSLLNETNDRFCVRYIFASTDEKLETSCRFLISIYHDYPDQAKRLFNEWFEGGKHKKEELISKYDFNPEKYEHEFINHKAWREKYQLITTPIVLLNGYRLPEIYKIEDLKYISNF